MALKNDVAVVLLVVFAVVASACGGGKPAPPAGQTPAAKPAAAAAKPGAALDQPTDLETGLPEAIREDILKPFKGDLDEMVQRRLVRVGVTYSRTFYFVDKGVQRGAAYDYGQMMEERLNKHFNPDGKYEKKIHVFFVPLPRGEKLLQALTEGMVDVVAAQVTVRPALEQYVTFANPTRTHVNEIVVTGPRSPAIASIDDLSGKPVFTRKNGVYKESLLALNDKFKAAGKAPVDIRTVPDNLEDDDLLEMVNAGLLPAIVVNDYLANFWKKVFPALNVHEDVAVRTGGSLAPAVRKNCPKTLEALNTFLGNYGLGTSFGNQIEQKYLVSTKYVRNAASQAERKKFLAIVTLFQKYGTKYNVDFLMMAAQGYQESRLNQEAKSQVGAIGVMQLMPATGKEMKVGDISQTEANIHAGVKYMHQTMDAFFANEPMTELDKLLFTFAAYNAGPGRIQQLRKIAEQRGLDPNVWFGNVEQIVSEKIGRETVTYVSNIYKYYVAYKLVMEESARRNAQKAVLKAKQVK